MALKVGQSINLKGGLQGSSTNLQGSAPKLQGSSPNLQPTVNPMNVPAQSQQAALGATSVAAPAADPYAAYGGTTAYNNLRSGFNNQKGAIYSSANDAASATGLGLGNSILDLVDSLRTAQTSIDNRGINNELARQRGVSDVNASIGRGIRSGGVTLANKNASDSSAAGAIARAYGDIGQRQLSDIGNQYELENQDIALAQEDLGRQAAAGQRRIQTSKEQAVNSIVSDANNQLAALDAAMANASLPDRIQIDAEKNAIRQSVLQTLAQYDSQLSRGVQGIRALDTNARMAEATRRGQLGQAPEAQFNFTTDTPTGLQGTGPVASELPIFTYRNREEV